MTAEENSTIDSYVAQWLHLDTFLTRGGATLRYVHDETAATVLARSCSHGFRYSHETGFYVGDLTNMIQFSRRRHHYPTNARQKRHRTFRHQ